MMRLQRLSIAVLAVLASSSPAPHSHAQASPVPSPARWTAPPEAKDVPNPVKTDGRTVDRGRKLFETYCVQCHGQSGVGDGAMAVKLGYKVANLTLENINQQTDGEIFWKISKGRAPMPKWEAQLSGRDRWDLVSYVRTLIRTNR